jgi:hypothetical protein
MFNCITNQDEVGKLVKRPKLMFKWPEGKIKAVIAL